MPKRTLISWLIATLVCCGSLVQAETLTGKVSIKTPIRKRVKARKSRPLRQAGDKRRYADKSKSLEKQRDEVRSVVVWVLDAPTRKKQTPATMLQQDRTFIPFVLPVTVGSEVRFPNNDKIYHGVYSESKAKPFELPQYADGESRSITFEKPGVIELFCHIHAHMNAYILVLENSYFTQPDEQHRYQIPELPPGKYRVKAWHPKLGSKIESVTIEKGRDSVLDFVL